jgi:hypothetical protein
MHTQNLSPNDPRVHFAQILGMSNFLTQAIALVGANAVKLIVYGKFDYLAMWLLRRWEENQVWSLTRLLFRWC